MSNSDLDKWYHILDLEPGAPLEQIKERWRVLCQVWHPDKHPAGSQAHKLAQEKQKQLNNAYDNLKRWFESSESTSRSTKPTSTSTEAIESKTPESISSKGKSTPPPSSPPPSPSSSSAAASRSPGTSLMPLPSDLPQGGAVITFKKQPTFYLALKELLYSVYLALGIDKSPLPPDAKPTFWNVTVLIFVLTIRRSLLALIAIGLLWLSAPTLIGLPISLWLLWHFTFDLRPEFQRRSIIEAPYMFTTQISPQKALDVIASVLGSPNSAGNQWEVTQAEASSLQAKLKYLDNSVSSQLELFATVYAEPPFSLVKLEFSLAGSGATPLAEKIISFTVPAVRRGLESAQYS